MKKKIEEHFRKHSNRLVKIAKRRLGFNEFLAEEAVQEAYVNALKYESCYNPKTKEFDAWFTTIFNNCVKSKKKEEMSNGITEELPDIEAVEVPHAMKAWLTKEIRKRNEDHQEVLTLHYVYGYSALDIFNIVNYTYDNIQKIINRFKHDVVETYNE